jgi:hypothetical protein
MKPACSALTLLLPSLAMAHPGHSPIPASSPTHYLLAHPDGIVLLVALAAMVVLMRWAADRPRT